jgi:hypothetical protein
VDHGLLWGAIESLGGALLAVAFLLVTARIGTAQYALVAPHDAEAVPMLHVLALAAGFAVGLALVAAVPYGDAFRPSRMFAPDSAWDISLGGFLANYALPRAATLDRLRDGLAGDGNTLQVTLGRIGTVLLLAGPLAALRWWRGRARLRALAAFLLLAGYTALVINYALHLAAWSIVQLNFWAFAVILLLFQRWRYAPAASGHH